MRNKHSNNIICLEKQTPRIEDSVIGKANAVVSTRSMLPKMLNTQEKNSNANAI